MVDQFLFDASASSDEETPASDLLVRWDFNNDGTWNTDYDTLKTQTHQYLVDGTFTQQFSTLTPDGNGNAFNPSRAWTLDPPTIGTISSTGLCTSGVQAPAPLPRRGALVPGGISEPD